MCDLLQPEIHPIENPPSLKTAPWNETQGRSEHPIQKYHHLKIRRWRKFDSHVTPNYDEYEKSAQKNVDAVLEYIIINHHQLCDYACILEETDFETGPIHNFPTFMTLDWVIWHNVM